MRTTSNATQGKPSGSTGAGVGPPPNETETSVLSAARSFTDNITNSEALAKAISDAVAFLKSNPFVAEVSQNGNTIFVVFRSGRSAFIIGSLTTPPARQITTKESSSKVLAVRPPQGRAAVVLTPFQWQNFFDTSYTVYNYMVGRLYPTSYSTIWYVPNSYVTLDEVANFFLGWHVSEKAFVVQDATIPHVSYGMFCLGTHGGIANGLTIFATGETYDDTTPSGPTRGSGKTDFNAYYGQNPSWVTTGQISGSSKSWIAFSSVFVRDLMFAADYSNGEMNSLFYANTCDSLNQPDMAQTMAARGVYTYLGWTAAVHFPYPSNFAVDRFFNSLTDGKTAAQAFQDVRNALLDFDLLPPWAHLYYYPGPDTTGSPWFSSGNHGDWTTNRPRVYCTIAITSNLPSGSSFARVDGAVITTPWAFTWTVGSTHTLEAISPVSGGSGIRYVWVSWSDGGSQTHTFTTTSFSQTVTANYKTQSYLTVMSAHDLPTPASSWFDTGTSITASVTTPADQSGGTRYRCTGWTGTGSVPSSGSASSVTFTISAPSSITWNWMAQYYLTVNTNPAEVSSLNPSAVSGQGWYDSGTTATVNAAQNVDRVLGSSRYDFRSWAGANPTGLGNQASVLMDGPKTSTANYQLQYKITFAQSGAGSDFTGTVVTIDGTNYAISGLPTWFWWDDRSTHSFAFSSPLVVTVIVKQYAWTSATGLSTAQSGSITVSGSGSETGNYKTQYYLSMQLNPSGAGSVTPLSGWYDAGSSLSIQASSASGWIFSSWTGSGSGSYTGTGNPATVTMNGPITETANFLVTVTISSNPAGSGFVKVDGTTITTARSFTWAVGSAHTLEAISPVSGGTGIQYVFTGWSDGGPQSHTYIVPSYPQTVTANYKTQYQATFGYTGLDSTAVGTVVTVDSSAKTYSDLPFSKWVDSGTSASYSYATIISSSATGKQFKIDTVTGSSSPMTVTGPTIVTGNYKTQYQLTMQVNPVGSGSTSPAVGTYWYDAGASVTITAVPASSWVFWSWAGVGTSSYSGSSNPANIVMNGPVSETVTFAALFTVVTTTTTSVTSTTYASSSVSTYQRSNTTTTATIPSTSYQTTTTTRYSGATSTTYAFRTTLYSTLTSLSTTTTTSTKMSTAVSTESTTTTRTTTSTEETTTEDHERLQYQGANTVTQTFTSTFTSGGTIYLKVIIQYTSIEQYLQRIISTILSWINQLTQVFQNIFFATTVRDTTVRVEPAPKLGETIGTLFSSNSSLGFMATGNIFDDSSLGFIYGHRNPPKVMFPKTDAARVNQTTKAPTWSDYTHLVMVGGRAANPTLAYYEDSGKATLKFSTNATHYLIMKGTTVAYAIVPSSITSTNDYFVMEVIPDGTHTVISLWGIGAPGTYAAGVCFDLQYTNLASLTAGWYVVRWQGTGTPLPSDTFTVVASGS